MTGTAMTASEMQEQRRAATVAMLEAPGKSLADLTDQEFEAGLRRVEKARERMNRILSTALQPKHHYDNPRNSFSAPILLKAGAEELRRLIRLRIRRVADPSIEATEDWVSVTVHLGIFDEMNRMIAERSANCNTREKRFRNKNGDWTYRDAREMVHQCLAMAEKRASVDLTEEAASATAFFQTEAALVAGIEDGEAVAGASPDDKRRIKDAARSKRLTRDLLFELIVGATGRPIAEGESEPFVAADEVRMVLDAIEAWEPRRPTPQAAPSVEDQVFGEEND